MTELTTEMLETAIKEEIHLDLAQSHPAYFLHHLTCVDSRSGDRFQFQLLTELEAKRYGLEYTGQDWYWQRAQLLDWWMAEDETICYKGRQIGVTWTAGGFLLWKVVFSPGVDCLAYSIGEDEAVELIQRIWDMYLSAPAHLTAHLEVVTPKRGPRPYDKIEFQHPDGRISGIYAMPSTTVAGHSRAVAVVLFDEAARQRYAREIWGALVPTMSDRGGKVIVVSTANGVSNPLTGEGNFFHYLWEQAGKVDLPKLKKKFFGWWLHPSRDDHWYENVSLPPDKKAENFPNTPEEGFLVSGRPFFDPEAIRFYANHASPVFYRFDWRALTHDPSRARQVKSPEGLVEVYREPVKGDRYAIGVDVATGKGRDYTVCSVLSLASMECCAEIYAKLDVDVITEQLHFLARWYNTAEVAVEMGGGYGESVVLTLRDGKRGRKPYANLYRHVHMDRGDRPRSQMWGFPMNVKMRPHVLDLLREALRERLLPDLPEGLLGEVKSFVYRDTPPSPAAADGCFDDRVFAWAIALYLYQQHGVHEHDVRREAQEDEEPIIYPWRN